MEPRLWDRCLMAPICDSRPPTAPMSKIVEPTCKNFGIEKYQFLVAVLRIPNIFVYNAARLVDKENPSTRHVSPKDFIVQRGEPIIIKI